MAYKIYISDLLFYYQDQSQKLTARFIDVLNTKVDTRTGDEVALDVISKAGLRFKS